MDLARPLSVITPTLDADVLQVLAGANASFTAPQVHRFVGGRSESGVRRTLQRLVVQGIVHVTTTGRTNSYVLNRQHLAAEHVLGLTQLRTRLADAIAEAVGVSAERTDEISDAADIDVVLGADQQP